MGWFYMDGELVAADEARVSVRDLALLRGYGIFDYLRTYNRRPFHLEEHLYRLQRSARLIDLAFPWSVEELSSIAMKTLDKNSMYKECDIRLVVTGGVSQSNYLPEGAPGLFILVQELSPLPTSLYTKGAKVTTVHDARYCTGAKTLNYIPAILAMKEAKKRGAVEALYVNPQGYILEGTTSNVFFVSGNTLITPALEILPGITRKVVLYLAKDMLTIEERAVHKDELRLMDEVFITASNKEIMPVTGVDTLEFGGGPGEKTRRIMEGFRQYTKSYGLGEAGIS